ncbi:MAG TPA: glycerol-3-phosphate 1-O-acyltransferase PlsY [Candidatus Hydrogenedentes bacterium]|nr:glycerol-3-phosphate 1-O-acyltransferase PlsY [Candidatus Hydrogenedentota bacterium]HOK90375.1 glycerol-3-phosphate 1-O-acyltransferase PlsY [Candidatus Hydrogenedentota bacterium]HOV59552.1 glycerol-3-phosphate 1-O-acyltransferase PlsY [Candidatus Hydrogenedentota bacterium]
MEQNMTWTTYLVPFLWVAGSYLLGSIPTGLWLGLYFRRVDIRKEGSRNIGATNTFRVLGKGFGLAALAGDVFKGWFPVTLATQFMVTSWPWLPLACGIAAVLGHTFSVFLWFRGGKGVATGTGVYLALAPLPTLIAAVVFGICFGATRMVSVGSISAAATLAVTVLALPGITFPVKVVTPFLAVLVIWKHRDNIRRIIEGKENRIL